MHRLQFAFLLLSPAFKLFAIASPHPRTLNLFKYPGDITPAATPFVSLTLGKERAIDSYEVKWKGDSEGGVTDAVAMTIGEHEYDAVKEVFVETDTYLGSGQDAQKEVWIITPDVSQEKAAVVADMLDKLDI